MQLMILVDDAGGVLPAINHSPWNGLTLADVVMPFFLFMVGVSLGLTYKVSKNNWKFIVFTLAFKHLKYTTRAMIVITSAVVLISLISVA